MYQKAMIAVIQKSLDELLVTEQDLRDCFFIEGEPLVIEEREYRTMHRRAIHPKLPEEIYIDASYLRAHLAGLYVPVDQINTIL